MGGEIEGSCMAKEGVSRAFLGRLCSGVVRNNTPFVCTDVSFLDHLLRTHKPQFAEDESLKNDHVGSLYVNWSGHNTHFQIHAYEYQNIKLYFHQAVLKNNQNFPLVQTPGTQAFFVNS